MFCTNVHQRENSLKVKTPMAIKMQNNLFVAAAIIDRAEENA